MTPFRWFALVVAVVGLLLAITDLTAGVYVLSAAMLLYALDDILRRNLLVAIFETALAVTLLSDHEDVTVVFYIAASTVIITAVPLIVRELTKAATSATDTRPEPPVAPSACLVLVRRTCQSSRCSRPLR